jgi:single-stranded-DNA-specific exonuclease
MTISMGEETKRAAVPPIVARILTARGIEETEMHQFLYPDYERDVHDPFLLTDMDRAVKRIALAAKSGEKVTIYGDYDIDGITASALMIEGLATLGIQAESYIPDRFSEGYGINREALETLQNGGTSLVISVDCGITSVDEARWASEHGLDLIITDHHDVPPIIPEAVAVVNPKRPDDPYPFKDLAGVGVAFKVIQALQRSLGKPEVGQEKWLLDLVALGTVCDVVTLVGENRALVSFGLRVIRLGRRIGIGALANVGGADVSSIGAYHLGYVLGPRMNAAGRLEHAGRSLELMRTSDPARAHEIADELNSLNLKRRADQEAIFAMADKMAEEYINDPVLVLAHAEWSHGVVGIVASKIADKWQKPVLIAQILGDSTKGSARSAGGFNMIRALRAQSELLTKFGGHAFAAGFTLSSSRLDELRERLNAYLKTQVSQSRADEAVTGELTLEDLSDVNMALLEDLEMLEPHGNGNPRPNFQIGDLRAEMVSRVGTDGKHLKLRVVDRATRSLDGIGFGLGPQHLNLKVGQGLTLTGSLNKNEYLGRSSVQLVIGEINYEQI